MVIIYDPASELRTAGAQEKDRILGWVSGTAVKSLLGMPGFQLPAKAHLGRQQGMGEAT